MATDGWDAPDSIERQLYNNGSDFDFYQAVRLLEWLYADQDRLGETAQPERESVRFHSAVGFDFPPSDIATIQRGRDGHQESPEAWQDIHNGQATMLINFLGLAGIHGPLPPPVTKLIMERSRAGDEVLRDFLDIFNHRLAALMYRVRKIHRRGMANVAPGAPDDRFGQYLYALIGLGSPSLQGRLPIPDRALLRYAGLLATQPRSALGLELLLSDYFQLPVKVEQFQGR
ncbi:MAG: type VI secretion system baseplate subunit TssG, partial [Oscillochloris sp.]|nr:type VI secretion system baseplate subunit TssG [Oscillochloris sp.]